MLMMSSAQEKHLLIQIQLQIQQQLIDDIVTSLCI